MPDVLIGVLSYAGTIRFAWFLASIASVLGIAQLGFNDDYRSIFRTNGVEFTQYEQLNEDFGSGENDFVVLIQANELLTPANVKVIGELHHRLNQLPQIERVVSLFSLRDRRRIGRYLLPVLRREMPEEDWSKAIEKVRRHALARGNLISESGNSTLLFIRLAGDSLAVNEIELRGTEIRNVLDELTFESSLRGSMTGLPAMRTEIVRGVQRDQLVLTTVAIVLCALLAWLMFRSLTMIGIVCLAPFTGTFWTLGCMGLIGEELNVLNTVVPTLLIVVGFTDSVHLMFEIRRYRDAGQPPPQATWNAVRNVGPACVLTSLTTAIGFGSLVAVDDHLIQHFGLTCAFGTLIVMVAVLTFVPLLAKTRLGIRCVSSRTDVARSWEQRLSRSLADRTLHLPGRLSVIAVVATVALSIMSLKIVPDFRYSENLPSENEARWAAEECDREFHGTSQIHVVVQLPRGGRMSDKRLFQLLGEIHETVERPDETSNALSLLSLLESLPGDSKLENRLGELKYLPRDVVAQFVNLGERRLSVTARVPDLGSAQLLPLFAQLRRDLSVISAKYPDYEMHLTGVPVLSTFRSQTMIRDLARSLVTASIVVFGLLAIAFRSIWIALITLIPNLFPLAATAASYVVLDQSLRYSGVVCFSICLGIAVDDTIHFLVRYRLERGKCDTSAEAVRQTLIRICPVLITTTILTGVGFGVALLSVMPTIRLFGMTICGALVFALLADLFFLPSLLILCERRKNS